MYAFWEYDLFPYYDGGKIKEIKGQSVTVEGYDGYTFKPKFLMDDDSGKKFKKRLYDLQVEMDMMIREQDLKTKREIENLPKLIVTPDFNLEGFKKII